jgi:hypothetical protein
LIRARTEGDHLNCADQSITSWRVLWEEEVAALLATEPLTLTGERLSNMAIPYWGALELDPRRGEMPFNAAVGQDRRHHLIRVWEATRLSVERNEADHYVTINQLTALIHYGTSIGVAIQGDPNINAAS